MLRNVIILATYNGRNYIERQLDSIRLQTVAPDFVIISDDNSSDGTPQCVMQYIEKYSLKNWKLIENENNKGYANNFLDLLNDYKEYNIFLSDQDDIWDNNKISKLINIAKTNEEILLLCAGYTTIDKNERKIKTFFSNGTLHSIDIRSLIKRSQYPGMTFYIKTELLQKIFPIKNQVWIHDYYLALCAACLNGFFIYEESLVNYRQHSNNAIGIKNIQSSYALRLNNLRNKIKNDDISIVAIERYGNQNLIEFVLEKKNLDINRQKVFERRDFKLLFSLLPKYLRFYGFISFLSDLYYTLRFSK